MNTSLTKPAPAQTKVTALLSLLAALLALYASCSGLFLENLYKDSVAAGSITEFLRVGSIAQDIITIPIAVTLAILSIFLLVFANSRTLIAVIGLLSYHFYAYALYCIQGQYTSIYLAYLAILGLSLYGIIYGLIAFQGDVAQIPYLRRPIRITIAVLLLTVLAVLIPVWLTLMLPGIQAHKPMETYGVFVLDLAIVFPALAITALHLLRGKAFGNILAGVTVVKVFTVCLSVAFGEWYSAILNDQTVNVSGVSIFASLTIVSGALCLICFRNLKTNVIANVSPYREVAGASTVDISDNQFNSATNA